MNTVMSFGDWVRRQRKAIDLTQDELARQVGCATTTIKKIETNARRPSKPMAARLADCLHISADLHADFLSAARLSPGLPAATHEAQAAHDISAQLAGSILPGISDNKPRTNLPTHLTSFVGRKTEIANLIERMNTTRLLTLTGAGGVGKTRLALEVAAKLQRGFDDGIWLIELASLADPALVAQAVSNAFSLIEHPGRTHQTLLIAYLSNKQCLLILDNCEHLAVACAELAEALLRACPRLQVLATSREPLRVPGEVTWRVPSLTTPDLAHLPPPEQPEQLMNYEAIQLLVQHAAMALPAFTLTPQNVKAVAQICYHLDGIPLAIEMAGAQVAALSVEEIADGLGDELALLTSGHRTALLRHQTLRATLDWSYNLLDPAEQNLLLKLSVFAGGWTADAAKAICANSVVLPLLIQLVHKSLVVAMPRDSHDQTRYRLLETIRQYAHEKLQTMSTSGALSAFEERALRRHHLDFYLGLAERAEPKLHTGEATYWLDQLEVDHDNLRAAIDWAFENGETTYGLRLVGALCEFWDERNHFQEQREQLAKALAKSSPAERTSARATVLNRAAGLANFDRNHDEARRLLDEALSIGTELNDQANIAQALLHRGWDARIQGDFAAAREFVENALSIWRGLGHTFHIAYAHMVLAAQAEHHGEYERARSLLEEALSLLIGLGEKTFRARSLYRLGRMALYEGYEGDVALATTLCRQGLELILETGNRHDAASCLATCARVALVRGQSIFAAQVLGSVERLLKELDSPLLHADAVAYEHDLDVLRTQLGEVAFDAARVEGRTLTFEQAMKYALKADNSAV